MGNRAAKRFLWALVFFIPGCVIEQKDPSEPVEETPVADVEAVGARKVESQAMFIGEGWCPSGVECFAADMNGDRKNDLVRIDRAGAFGAPGGRVGGRGQRLGLGQPGAEGQLRR